MLNGTTSSRQPSTFVKPILDDNVSSRLFCDSIDRPYDAEELRKLSQVLRRELTTVQETAALAYSAERSTSYHVRQEVPPHDVTNMVGFTSARAASIRDTGAITSKTAVQSSHNILPPADRKLRAITQLENSSTTPPLLSGKRKAQDTPCSDTESTRRKAESGRSIETVSLKSHASATAVCVPQSKAQSSTIPSTCIPPNIASAVSGRRRLGMGHTGGGYTNKKFKSQVQPRS
jgi:hypothetical protein